MAVAYSSTLKNNRLQLVADLIAGKVMGASTGSGSQGKLVIGTSSLSGGTGVLATITLNNPPGTVSGGVLTISGVPLSVAASGSGTAEKAEFRDSLDNVIAGNLSVGVSSADVIINATGITAGQTVTCTAATITHG